jgi:membrane peptidoglycan carboxypeptidase
MDKKFRSIIDELSDYVPDNKELFIEARGRQVIASALNLVALIKENFDEETASDLTKRLVRSILSEDQEKFTRKVRQLRESRKK